MSKQGDADAVEARRAKVAALILAGWTQREMANSLGVSLGTINNDVSALRKEWQEREQSAIAEHIAIDLQRLEAAISAIWLSVQSGDMKAIHTMIDLLDSKMKLLGHAGLWRSVDDAAAGRQSAPNIFVTTHDGVDSVDNALLSSIASSDLENLDTMIQNLMIASGISIVVDGEVLD